MVLEAKYFHGVGAFEVYLIRGFRSKAFSPVCLSRFSGLQPFFLL
jgi:hypothetical protein